MLCVCVVDVIDVVFSVCIVRRHSLHVAELPQRSGKPCANWVDLSRPSNGCPITVCCCHHHHGRLLDKGLKVDARKP